MSRMFVIWKKELRSYFGSAIAYIFLLVFLVYAALQFFVWTRRGPNGEFRGNFFLQGEAALTDYFAVFPLALSVLVPVLCMRLWPEEYKSGTIEVLMTLPVRAWEVVLGKFCAMLSILALTFLLSLSVPLSVSMAAVEGLDLGPVIGGYVAAFLMGAAYCSVGLLASSFVREQAVALLLTLIVCIPLAVAGTPNIDILTPAGLSTVGKFIGFTVRFESIEKGMLDLRDMFYFISFATTFVVLNVTVLEYRRLK